MITGTTKSGFNFEIAEETLDDYELLEALVEADKGDDNSDERYNIASVCTGKRY